MSEKTRHYIKFAAIPCIVILAAIPLYLLMQWSLRREMFRRVVAHPIPKSVQEIRTDTHGGKYDRIRIVYFDVSKEDLPQVVASGSFKSLPYAEYSRRCVLRYGLSERVITMLSLYRCEDEKPQWLDLERWTDFTAYFAEREVPNIRYSVRIMLYNEHLQRACVVEREMRGPWGGESFRITDPVTGEMPSRDLQSPEQKWLGPPELRPGGE
jgi:hypothetical protein